MKTELWNPIDDILEGVGDWFSDVLRNVIAALIQGLTEAISAVGTWFLYLPAPVLQGEGGEWSPAERVQAYTAWAIPVIGIIATAFALIVVARRKDADTAIDTAIGLIRVILVAGAAIPGIYLLVKFGDEASPWLLKNISGGTFEEGLGQLVGLDAAAASGMAVGVMVLLIPVLLISVLGGLLNMVFMMFSYGVLPVIAGLLPLGAAYAMTARGKNTFGKLLGWVGALVLFKPVAAVIYGVGIASARMITGGVEDAGQVVLQALYGCVLLCTAFIALPVLVRLVAPAAAAGIRGGGAGAVLAGAAMIAGGAITGGAAAVAGVAAQAGGAAAGTAATGAAAGTAAASTAAAGTAAGTTAAASTAAGTAAGTTAGTAGGGSAGTAAAAGSGGGSAGTAGGGSAGTTTAPNPSSGAPANGSQWAQRWNADSGRQIQQQGAQLEGALEAGDDR